MTAPHRIEQHDGRGWKLVVECQFQQMAAICFALIKDKHPTRPVRMVMAECRRIVALHDPRHGYAYPETTT